MHVQHDSFGDPCSRGGTCRLRSHLAQEGGRHECKQRMRPSQDDKHLGAKALHTALPRTSRLAPRPPDRDSRDLETRGPNVPGAPWEMTRRVAQRVGRRRVWRRHRTAEIVPPETDRTLGYEDERELANSSNSSRISRMFQRSSVRSAWKGFLFDIVLFTSTHSWLSHVESLRR